MHVSYIMHRESSRFSGFVWNFEQLDFEIVYNLDIRI